VRGSHPAQDKIRARPEPFATLTASVEASERPCDASGTALLLPTDAEAPSAFLHNLKHNSVPQTQNYVISVRVEPIRDAFTRVALTFGYRERTDVPVLWRQGAAWARNSTS